MYYKYLFCKNKILYGNPRYAYMYTCVVFKSMSMFALVQQTTIYDFFSVFICALSSFVSFFFLITIGFGFRTYFSVNFFFLTTNTLKHLLYIFFLIGLSTEKMFVKGWGQEWRESWLKEWIASLSASRKGAKAGQREGRRGGGMEAVRKEKHASGNL